jgi:hypothetical protein
MQGNEPGWYPTNEPSTEHSGGTVVSGPDA